MTMPRIPALIALFLPALGLAQSPQAEIPLNDLAMQVQRLQSGALPVEQMAQRLEVLGQQARDQGELERAHKLAHLTAVLRNPPGWRHPLQPERVSRQLQTGVDSGHCPAAVEIADGETLRLSPQDSAGQATTWLRFVAPQVGAYGISTLGSEGDPRLEAWASCAQRPGELLDRIDDYYGLQAALLVKADRVGQAFLIRLDNTTPLARQQISVVGGGYNISGEVTLAGPASNSIEVVANSLDGFYLGSRFVGGGGSYTLNIFNNVDAVLRTSSYFGARQPYLMLAHPDRPCFNAYSSYAVGNCGELSDMTVFTAAQAPHSNVNFHLPVGGSVGGSLLSEGSNLPISSGVARISVVGQGELLSASTDQFGRYQFGGLPAASYVVEAHAQGHVSELYDNVACPSGSCNPALATPIQVALGGSALANFALQDLRRLTVEVSGVPNGVSSVVLNILEPSGSHRGSYSSGYVSDGIARFQIDLAAGPFRMYLQNFEIVSQVYPDILCDVESCFGQATSGSVLEMPAAGPLTLSMTAQRRPVIRGRVTSAADGSPLRDVSVLAYQVAAQYPTTNRWTDADGRFELSGLYPGTYHLYAQSNNHLDAFYPDFICQGPAAPLDLCSGAPTLSLGLTDRIADFVLPRGGVVTGHVDSSDGFSLPYNLYVGPISSSGDMLVGATVSSSGDYRLVDLMPEPVRLGMHGYSQVFPSIYPGIICERPQPFSGTFANCPGGTPLLVPVGGELTNIDFTAVLSDSRVVQVRRLDTGLPVVGAAIDYWSVDGFWRGAAMTNAQGIARVEDYPGPVDLILSTSNAVGLIDEVYNNIACPDGPAFFGLCSLAGATPVSSWPAGPTTPPLQIVLMPQNSDLLWVDGFED